MDQGFKYQIKLVSQKMQGDVPPRVKNVHHVARSLGLLDVWLYEGQAREIFARHRATMKTTCYDIVRIDLLYERKDAVLRAVLEHLNMPPEPGLAVVTVAGTPRSSDSKSFVLELDMGLGAHGATSKNYPIRGLGHDVVLVDVSDAAQLREFCRQQREGQAKTGTNYGYFGELHEEPGLGSEPHYSALDAKFLLDNPVEFHAVLGSNWGVPMSPEQELTEREQITRYLLTKREERAK